jgi:dolichol kinase
LTATVVELLPLPLDDNALIPMLSGMAMQIVILI